VRRARSGPAHFAGDDAVTAAVERQVRVELQRYGIYRVLRGLVSARPALTGFVLLFGVLAAWSLATPQFAAPDEPAHVVKAVATVRGQFVGHPIAGLGKAYTQVRIPATFGNAYVIPSCFAFHQAIPAGCGPVLHAMSGTVVGRTYVGRYPPLYYLLVGLPSGLRGGGIDLYLMRLVSAALSAAFLLGAFISAARSRQARLMVPGVAVGVTPSMLFLGGIVNPSGLEISAGACVWASALVYFTEPERRSRRLLLRAALAAAVLVQLRGLSPLWLAIIALFVFAVAGWRRVRSAMGRRDVQVALGVVGLCGILAVAWIFGVGSLSLTKGSYQVSPTASEWQVTRQAFHETVTELSQMIGLFGWNDTRAPGLTNVVWLVGVLALVAAGLVQRRWRRGLLPIGLCAVVIVVPTVLAISQARTLGIVEQARYVMPLSVGIPILAGYLAPDRAAAARWVGPLLLGGGALLGIAHCAAFVQALHRYRTGLGTPLFSTNAKWSPPIPIGLLVAVFGVLMICYWLWWWTLPRTRVIGLGGDRTPD